MSNPDRKTIVLAAVHEGIEQWTSAYNAGDAALCSEQYETSALLQAEPFGSFKGKAMIQEFWRKMINLGFTGIRYAQTELEAIDDYSAYRKTNWTMNKAHGVIYQEKWYLQEGGNAKLRYQSMEIMGWDTRDES